MLAGNADWCGDIVESLKLEEGICREFADSVLVEMEVKILNNNNMDKVLQKSLSDMNKKLQTGLALGAMILRPLGPDKAEYVAADKFIPISFDDSGIPNDIAFLVVKCVGENNYYTRVERHYFTNGNLTIENKCYHSQSQNDIGQSCSLDEVAEWESILPGPIIYPGMIEMDFGYYQNPIENKVDGSSCGVSVYESAENLIRKADVQGARLDWEYDSGERAIHVDDRALKKKEETLIFQDLRNVCIKDLILKMEKIRICTKSILLKCEMKHSEEVWKNTNEKSNLMSVLPMEICLTHRKWIRQLQRYLLPRQENITVSQRFKTSWKNV